jgi:glycerol-3-phosphate cytidylyltransferase
MRTGIIAGAFDILHPGYIKAFAEAKDHCDWLVVCVHIDPSLERPEKGKPVIPLIDRFTVLRSIRYVDELIPYDDEEDFLSILKRVNPIIRFLGEDYTIGIKAITGQELNIPIHYLDRSHGWSETKLRKMIYKSMTGGT